MQTTDTAPRITSATFGRCRSCRSYRWQVPGSRPIIKHVCAVVGTAWAAPIERRKGAR